MTEQEWLVSENPLEMLEYVSVTVIDDPPSQFNRERMSDRKLRLFACGCCRLIWPLLNDDRSRRAVGVSEWYADGGVGAPRVGLWEPGPVMTDRGYLQKARQDALDVVADWRYGGEDDKSLLAARMATWSCQPSAARAAHTSKEWGHLVPYKDQADLLRDIVGSPFRRVCLCGAGAPQADCPRAARLRTSAVLSIAKTAYSDRDFGILPILADALQDAGCDNVELLRHLHGWGRCPKCVARYGTGTHANCPGGGWVQLSGPHARGCWVLDLVLGKE